MSYNGSGTFLINSAGQPVVANTVISATVFNALTSDLATGLSTAITKDGQTTITANIPFGSNKITGLGAGTAATDAANLSQVQSTVAKLVTVTGTDTITGSMSPQLTAYAAGQLFYFVANAANTGPVTINIDSLGAKAITRDGSTALAAGDINSGEVVVVIYDGTRFQMINAANSFGNTTINGTLTVTGNTGLQANVSITSTLSVGGTFAVTGAATLGSTLAVTGKSDLPTVSTASINAAVALITTGTVTNLTASGASIASANIGNLQFTAASIASINAGVAVITNLTATGASIASANVGTAVITAATVTGASIASANVGTAVITTGTVTNLTSTSASVASINAAVALITTGTVTNLTSTGASVASANVGVGVITALTATGASVASANVGTAVVTGLTVTNASIASLNAGTATVTTGNLTFSSTAQRITGDMSNATFSSRLAFQSSTTNGNTILGILANGTPADLAGTGVVCNAVSDTTNTQTMSMFVFKNLEASLRSNAAGTGTYLPMTFYTGGSERMRLDTSGNLGIGTASPGSRLVVGNQSAIYGGGTTNENIAIVAGTPPSADTTRGMFGIYDQTSAAAGVGGSITFGGSFSGTTQTFFAGIKGVKANATPADATGDLLLAPRSGNTIFYGAMYSSERMRIDSSGNVGIGTASPAAPLQVVGAGRFGASPSQTTGACAIYNDGNNVTIEAFAGNNSATKRDIGLATYGGNVGIGTASPGAKLNVDGGAGNAKVKLSNTASGNTNTDGFDLDFTGANIYLTNRENGFMAFENNGAERMRIDAGGSVFVNATATGSYFDGKFNSYNASLPAICAKGDTQNVYVTTVYNTATSGDNYFTAFVTEASPTLRGSITYNRAGAVVAYNTTSDYRAKDVFGAWNDSGATIDALKVYCGKMHGATLERPMMIAHEAQAVVPYAVSGEKDAVDKDGKPVYQQMDHQVLVPLLIAELQAVRARLAALEAK